MNLVVDASVLAHWLLSADAAGTWATEVIRSHDLAAPHIVLAETANVLRKATLAATIPPQLARDAHRELVLLPMELFDYRSFAERVWELQSNVATYDAWYVALAEALDVPLATADVRLANAPGPRCDFLTPGSR